MFWFSRKPCLTWPVSQVVTKSQAARGRDVGLVCWLESVDAVMLVTNMFLELQVRLDDLKNDYPIELM